MFKLIRVGILACCATVLHGATPYFGIRSQGQDTARVLAGWTQETHIFRPDQCGFYGWVKRFSKKPKKYPFYGTIATTFEYTDTFNRDSLACCLFGADCLDECAIAKFTVSGSRVPNRSSHDWLADYFGLPPDFISRISLSPRVQNFLVGLDAYFGLDHWAKGLYLQVSAPVVHTKWSLDFCETVRKAGQLGYDEGYVTDGPLPRDALLDNFTQYITGQKTPEVLKGLQLFQAYLGEQIISNHAITYEPLRAAKWASERLCNTTQKTGIADLHVTFGYDFYNSCNSRFSAGPYGVFPTGTRPDGEFYFEPLVGNGHHWELGMNVSADYIPWRGYGESQLGIYLEGTVTHLFNNTQCRVFDLKNSCNSRYMLALKLGTPVEDLFAHLNPSVEDGAVAPDAQFVSTFSPVANLTRQRVRVGVDVQADLTAMINYTTCCGNLSWDVGYNFWFRSCENIKLLDCSAATNPLADGKTWALKGDSQVFGYTNIVPPCSVTCPIPIEPIVTFGSIIPLSPSQECATVHTGLNNFIGPDPDDGGIDGIRPTRNPGVDNAQFAQTTPDAADARAILDRFNPLDEGLPTKTSNNPLFLTIEDLNIAGAQTKKMSHKLFGAVTYRWNQCNKKYIPYLSLGGKGEFGRTSSLKQCQIESRLEPCEEICNRIQKCTYCTLSEWGIWLKGGVSF